MDFLNGKDYKDVDNATKQDLNKVVMDGLTWQVFYTLTFGGVFMIGFALFLGATPFEIGIISSLPFFANVAQLIGSYLIERSGRRKAMILWSAFVSRALWALIIIAPIFILPPSKSIWTIILVFGISSILNSITGVAWLSWMSIKVPKHVMGKFFSKRTAYMSIVGVVVGLAGGFFLDYWKTAHNMLDGFLALFSVGMVFSMFSVFYLARIKDFKTEGEQINLRKFVKMVKSPFKDIDFKRFLKFGIVWGFALGIAGPFMLVYQLDVLNLSYIMVVFFSTLFTVSGVLVLSKWGDVVDKYGAKPIVAMCALILSLFPLSLVFINNSNYMLLAPINIIAGIAFSGVDFASAQILLRTAPQTNRSIYFSAFMASNGIAFAISPIIGGFLAGVFANLSYSILFFTFSGLHFLFILSGLLRLWGASLVKDINEPESKPTKDVVVYLKDNRVLGLFANFYTITRFSFDFLAIPVIFGERIAKGGRRVFGKGIMSMGSVSIRTFIEAGRLINLSIKELGGLASDKKIIPRLHLLNSRMKTLEDRIKVDDMPRYTLKNEIEKVRTETGILLKRIENSPEKTKVPEKHLKKIMKLMGHTR